MKVTNERHRVVATFCKRLSDNIKTRHHCSKCYLLSDWCLASDLTPRENDFLLLKPKSLQCVFVELTFMAVSINPISKGWEKKIP